MKLRCVAIAVWLVCLSTCSWCLTPPLVSVPKTMNSVDSRLTPQILHLSDPKGPAWPSQNTEVRLTYDDVNLYVAFRCEDDDLSKLVTSHKERDSEVWSDDSVEVFLCPTQDVKSYFHLAVSAAGVVYDEKDAPSQPKSWNGNWSVHTGRDATAWTAVITIPFVSLGVGSPSQGATWTANLGRNQISRNERTCWSPTLYTFHEPERFGKIVFVGTDAVTAAADRVKIVSPGDYSSRLSVNNTSSTAVDLRVVVSISESPVKEMAVLAAPGASETPVSFSVDREGNRTLHVAVYRKSDSSLVSVSPGMPIRIPERRAKLAEMRRIYSSLRAAPAKEKAEVRGLLEVAEALLKTARGDAAWADLGAKVQAVEDGVERLRYITADRKGTGYALGHQSSLVKVRRDTAYWGELGGALRIDMPRNDYEAAQFVIVAYNRPLENVSVTVGSLKGPSGAELSADNLSVNFVDYVQTRKPIYDVDYVGWHPDPLMPNRPFGVKNGEVQPIWITVRAPEGTSAGVYKGTIEVKPADAPVQSLLIEVRVRDFALPKETHLKTAFAFFETEVEAWYGKYTPQMHRDYYSFLLRHRLNPTNIYSQAPVPSKFYIAECISAGMDFFNLTGIYQPDEKCISMIRNYESFLKKHGWWDKAYVYGWDEVQPPSYPQAREGFLKVKSAFPDLKTMCTVVPNEALDDAIDIWVPMTPAFDRKVADKYEARGDQVWWYVCCAPGHPYANWFVDYSAVEPRLLFWMNWKYKVPGFLYYAINMWESNRKVDGLPPYLRPMEDPAAVEAIRAGKRWPEVPWNTFTYDRFNGDGHLIYPGPDGKPISSIRLECIRDGIEDYECFYLLSELVKSAKSKGRGSSASITRAEKALAVREDVVKSLRKFTYDPELVLKARTELLDLIEVLR